jgi:hypothetical protein
MSEEDIRRRLANIEARLDAADVVMAKAGLIRPMANPSAAREAALLLEAILLAPGAPSPAALTEELLKLVSRYKASDPHPREEES